MTRLSDEALDRLRAVADLPDMSGTRYEVSGRVARGGMGTVYVARDRELRRDVALKVLHAGPEDEGLRRRMLREARVLAALEHPGIVPVHDVGTLPDGRVYYTMKLVHGERLDEWFARTPALRDRLRVFERICEAVAFAHARDVLHRDLKPQNVMVGEFGEALVMDWGLAKLVADPAPSDDDDVPTAALETAAAPADPADAETVTLRGGLDGDHTRHGTVLGTPGYMAPEQAAGRPDLIDRRSDVYALGAILRDALAGVRDPVPRRLRAIVDMATSAAPGERYDSVAALADDVRRMQAGEPVAAYPEGPVEKALRFAHTYRTPLLLFATYLAVRALVFLFAGT